LVTSIENSDWVCIINPEVKSDTEELYLTFKLLKRRYRSSEENEKLRRLDYFNQPFEPGNEIRLMDDIDLEKPLALESLATQFEAVDNKRVGVTERPVEKDSKKKKKMTLTDDFGFFEDSVHSYDS